MEHLVTRSLLLGMIFYVYNIHAIGVDRVTLEKIKKRQFAIVDFKDNDAVRLVTLEEIYGVPLNEQNFNPGEEFLNFLRATEGQIPTIQLSTHEFNDPHIHFHEFHHMTLATQESKKSKFVRIAGDPKTGKTSTLRWMYLDHIAKSPENLAIFVDIPRIAQNLPAVDHITLNSILRATVPAPFVGLIEDVANKNPKNIKIFLDGIDQWPFPYYIRMESLIQELYQKNMPLVVSGNPKTFMRPPLTRFLSTSDSGIVVIPNILSPIDLEDYTKQLWIKKLKQYYNLDATAAVKDYWKAFRIATQDIPLPQTIGAARLLADYVSNPNIDKPFIDLTRYVAVSPSVRNRVLRGVIKFSETHKFPTTKFYDLYFENSITPSQFQFYGKAASGMLNNKFHLGWSDWMGNYRTTNTLLNQQPVGSYPYLTFQFSSMKFPHEDFMNYFAAKYLMEHFVIENLVDRFIKSIARPHMTMVMQMIDSQLSTDSNQYDSLKLHLQLAKSLADHSAPVLSDWNRLWVFERALDNSIKNGFDNLASLLLEALFTPQQAMNYLQLSLVFNSEVHYRFGMIIRRKSSNIYSDFVLQRSHTFHGTRPQMIANFLMQRTIEVTKNLGFLWDGMYFLEAYVEQPNIMALHKMFVRSSYLRDQYPVQLFNRAMYESVKALGDRSIEIVKDLQILGGVPSEVDVDGSTLAHVAVKWGSLELVKILHESFGVSFNDRPDNSGKTILFAALEANPFTAVTPDGFWPMMEYLIENGDFQCNIEMIRNNPPKSVPITGIPPSYMILLTSSRLPTIKNALSAFELVSINEMEMSAALRSLRRNVIIQSCVSNMHSMQSNPDSVTVTEILTKYRGFNSLSPADQLAYERTIIKSLEREASSLSAAQAKRVFINIIRNMNADSELVRMWGLFVKKVEAHLPPELSSLAHNIFSAWGRGTIPRVKIQSDARSLMLRTRYDLSSHIKHDLPVTPDEYMNHFKYQLLISICDFL